MSYIVNYSTSTKTPITIATATIDNSTSISLVGKNTSGFGEIIAENFLHILENFASPVEPSNSVEGQLWYDTSDINKKVLKIKSGIASAWRPVSNIYFQTSEPGSAVSGELWVKYEDGNISFYAYVAGTGWVSLAESYVLISDSAPGITDQGRLWFNTTNKKLFVYTTTWTSIQSPAVYGTSVPASDLVTGQIWYNTSNSTAYIYNGTSWIQLVATATANDITFIQAGAGAVSRSQQNKSREFITPQDYGATGNGITNDSVAFTAANTAAAGKSVFVPDGTYAITGSIVGNFVALGNPTFTGGTITIKKLNDLSSIVTGTLAVINGGTGVSSLIANNVILGNGTSAVQTVAPGSNGNVLSSNGTTWQSSNIFAGTTSTKAMTATNLAVTPATLQFYTRSLVNFGAMSGTFQPVTAGDIESWVSKINIVFTNLSSVSVSGGGFRLQLEIDNVLTTSSYVSSSNGTLNTTGFLITTESSSSYTYSGTINIFLTGGSWVYSSIVNRNDGVMFTGSGYLNVPSGVLTNIIMNNITGSIFNSGPPPTFSYYRE